MREGGSDKEKRIKGNQACCLCVTMMMQSGCSLLLFESFLQF